MEIVDLAAERRKREAPDEEFVQHDEFGHEMYAFALSYRMDDAVWSATIWAYGFEDAERRVAAMRGGLTLDGQIYSVVTG